MTPEVLTLFLLNGLFFVFATLAFVLAVKLVIFYDKDATTQLQYRLQKQSYLAATIIKYIFAIKIPLFIFFIFTLETISHILPGAMCSAGVVNATDYGVYLLIFKIINLYLFAYWITLDAQDAKSESQPYIRLKFVMFLVLYTLLVSEISLEVLMFLNIEIEDVVDCCGVIFSINDGSYIASIIGASALVQTSVFYASFTLLLIAYFFKHRVAFGVLNILFTLISLVTLIGFFGTYIYEMPTHHCPFCLLSKEYSYVGYFLYIFLFLGTFFGSVVSLVNFTTKQSLRLFRLSMLFNALYMLSISSYVLLYFFKNSVWL